ncbi:glycoside hydrolase family 13 protein [Athelia psychrophila]|uniref:Glycoside hydrolase family 13 protein n=1 Tax=Athelia psychrophila TaxID=1759441 RepID=A0A166KP17_9AGAM|nr:glycoside hydrolase family 13 protein [Fibularhizoctonia sp. CBS 109695]
MAHHANLKYRQRRANSAEREHNYTMLQAFEWDTPGGGKHWKWFEDHSEELGDMGITVSTPYPPPTRGSSPDDVGYGIYDIWDLGEFEQKGGRATKYGTIDELKSAIKKAKANGIVCYIDAVLNHRLGADGTETFLATEVDEADRNKETSDLYDIEGWTQFDFAGRGGAHSKLQLRSHHFTGVDYDAKTGKKGIFKIKGDGKTWSKNVDKENSNYDYLMGADLDHSHPEVRQDILDWGVWIVKELDAAGFRFDAVKHIDSGFIRDFVKHVREKSGKDSLFVVGEFWKDSLDALNTYLDTFGSQFSLFDTPLHYNFKAAADAGRDYDIRQIWDGSLLQVRPTDAVTVVDNHDTQPGQSLESWITGPFKPIAYALILLRADGYPCVFIGDLYGLGGEHPAEPVAQLADLIRARKQFAYGEQRDYWDHVQCAGWVRVGDKAGENGQGAVRGHDGCAVVLSIGDAGAKRMEVGREHAGEVWTDVLGWHQGEVTIGEDGWAEFGCEGASVSVWVKRDARDRKGFSKEI